MTTRTIMWTAVLTAAISGVAAALPPGRAWTPVEKYKVPGHTALFSPDRMDLDSTGSPLVFGNAVGGIGRDVYGLRWADSTWVPEWNLGYGTAFLWPVVSPPGRYHLVWKGLGEVVGPFIPKSALVMAEARGSYVTPPDTVAMIFAASFAYGAAASERRRWAADSDYGDLRLFYSDTVRIWHEVEVPGRADHSVALAALNDTTVLLVSGDTYEGACWGILAGTRWTQGATAPVHEFFAAAPRICRRSSGGFWTSWSTKEDHVTLASFRDGVWSPPETLHCAYRLPHHYYSDTPVDLSRDDGEFPAVVWSASDAITGEQTICVVVPNDSGFTVGENLDESEGEGLPTIARDRNEDVWVGWWKYYDGMFWVHTYSTATARALRIEGAGRHRAVAWTLSQSAPGTWWEVLRSRNGGDFEPVTRVRAGRGLDMSWADTSPPAGRLRYRIRRPCVDKRYEWESGDVRWPAGRRGPFIRLISPASVSKRIEFAVEDVSVGPAELRLFDLQGRIVARQQAVFSGSGRGVMTLQLPDDNGEVPSGIYFLSVEDATGLASPAARIVVLR